MIGDSILIYDPDNGFFKGFKHRQIAWRPLPPIPVWTWKVNEARITNSLAVCHKTIKQIGGRARIISETQARRIEAYIAHVQQDISASEPLVLP